MLSITNIYSKPTEELEPFSPVLPSALSYYNYQLESSSIQNGTKVYRIQVIPKTGNPMLYKGTIDIVDSLWCVSGFDLFAKIDMGVISMDYHCRQIYSELEKDIYQPVSYIIQATGKMLGMTLRMSNAASIKYIDYKLNSSQTSPDDSFIELIPFVFSEKSKSYEEKINILSSKEYLTNKDLSQILELIQKKEEEDRKNNKMYFPKKSLEIKDTSYVVTFDKDAHDKDSAYWDKNRLAPLSSEETESFPKKKEIDEKLKIKDSLRQINNASFNKFFSGKIKIDSLSSINISLLSNFNLVDGYLIGVKPSFLKKFRDSTEWEANLRILYATDSKQVSSILASTYQYFPEKQAFVTLAVGRNSNDFNSESGMISGLNSISALVFRENYINFYNRAFLEIRQSIEAFNGFIINAGFNYEKQKKLHNISDYSFFFKDSWGYRSNDPDNYYTLSNPVYLQNATGAIFDIGLSYTPEMYYRYEHRKKINLHSKYPTFSFLWKKGIVDLFNSTSNFDQLELGIKQQIKLHIFKTFDYKVMGGWFMNSKNMHFSSFKHFSTPEFPLMISPLNNNYHTVKSYSPSTNEWYLSGFFQYKTPYLLFKYLPFLDNTLIFENLYFSYLTTPIVKNYMEIGYAMTDIYSMGNIGFFAGFEDFKYANWSFKIAFTIPKDF